MTKLIFYIIDVSESDDDSYENECAIDYKAYEKNKEINIKFLKVSNEFNPKKFDKDLYRLLKLSLLKEYQRK